MKSKFLPVAIVSIAAVSCIDPQYDLVDSSLKKDIAIFNEGISLPVGSIQKIMLSQFIEIEEDGIIQEDAATNGYYITKSGNADEINIEIGSTKISNEGFNFNHGFKGENSFKELFLNPIFQDSTEINLPINVDEMNISEAAKAEVRTFLAENGLDGDKYEIMLDEENSTEFDIDINDIPKEIKKIKRIDFEPFNLDFSFNLENLDFYTNGVFLGKDFRLIIPEEIITDDEEIMVDEVTNERYLSFSNKFIENNSIFNFSIKVTAIEFQTEQEIINGSLNYHGEFVIDGNSYITKFNADAKGEELINIPIIINADSFSPTIISSTGIYDFDIDPVNEFINIDKNDLPDFLAGDDVVIDATHAAIELIIKSRKTANNESGRIPAELQLVTKMEAVKNGTTVGDPINETIIIGNEDAEVVEDNEYCYYKYLISDNGEQKEGYKSITVENMESLMKVIPDEIKLNADIEVGEGDNAVQTIETKDVNLLIDYSFSSPLEFGTDLNIAYSDTIDGINSTLEGISTKGIKLAGNIEFEIPVDIKLEANALDLNGNRLEGITVKVTPEEKIQKGSQPFDITITTDDPNLISNEFDGIELKMTLGNENYDEANRSQIKSTDYITLKDLKLSVIGGIILDGEELGL